MSRAPEVSVVIPTRNRRDVLERTVRGVLAQRGVDVEVVVVDDGSTDGTGEALAALDPSRLRVVRHPESLGLARARNAGLAVASAPWIALLDDDDRWAPGKLRAQLDAAASQAADFVYSSAVVVADDGLVRELLTAPAPEALRAQIRVRNVVPAGASNVLVGAELVRAVGGFDVALAHLADWDLWLRLTEAGRPGHCPEIHVAYMLHAANMHLSQAEAVAAEARHLRVKHAASSLPGELDAAALDGWAGWAQVRAGRHLAAVGYFSRALLRSRDRAYTRSLAGAALRGLGLRPDRRPPVRTPEWVETF